MKKVIWRIAICSLAASGCGSVSVVSAPASWRHPFLYHENRSSGKTSTLIPEEILKEHGEVREICGPAFGHSLLNRCRRVIPRGANLPAARKRNPEDGLKIAAIAVTGLSGKKSFSGRDCSSFVLGVLKGAGYDLRPRLRTEKYASAAAIFKMLEREGKIHRHKVPMPGDLVFFDNTYDRNRDGRANDPLTHVGIVEKVDADGTISFIHRVRRGVLRYRMNLFHPDLRRDPKTGKVLNHHLRFAERGKKSRLAGELFHAFANPL